MAKTLGDRAFKFCALELEARALREKIRKAPCSNFPADVNGDRCSLKKKGAFLKPEAEWCASCKETHATYTQLTAVKDQLIVAKSAMLDSYKRAASTPAPAADGV